jgi:hypothetical protein
MKGSQNKIDRYEHDGSGTTVPEETYHDMEYMCHQMGEKSQDQNDDHNSSDDPNPRADV